MSKKRRTRAQKIIAQLKKELRREQAQPQTVGAEPKTKVVSKNKSTDEMSFDYQSLKDINIKPITQLQEEKVNLYTYDPHLIKKDLLKTFYLSGFFFALIGFCYWYFR